MCTIGWCSKNTDARRQQSRIGRSRRQVDRVGITLLGHENAHIHASAGGMREGAHEARIGHEVGTRQVDPAEACADGVQRSSANGETIDQFAVGDHGERDTSDRSSAGEAFGFQTHPSLHPPVPGVQEDRFDGRDGRTADLDRGVVPIFAACLCGRPAVRYVDPASEGYFAIANQRLAVVAPDERPKTRTPESVGMVRHGPHAGLAHAFEESGGSVAAADKTWR